MKRISVFVFIVFFNHSLYAQTAKIDSLKKVLTNTTDTGRVNTLNELSTQYLGQYSWAKSDASLIAAKHCTEQALALSQNINFIKGSFLNI